MKNWRIVVVLLLILVLAGSVACRPFGDGDQEEASQQLIEVSRGDITLSITADGSLSLIQHRKLTFGTSGEIVEINVEEGDYVTEGQVLARLDSTTLEQAVETAEQAVETAELAVKTGELAVRAAEIDLELATNSYQQLITPYPYQTYRFILPESVDAIRVAQQRIKEAQDEFQKGLEGKQYSMAEVKAKLLEAQEFLAEAEIKLAWGFDTGIRPSSLDYWTLRAAQMQVEQAQLALDRVGNDLDQLRNNLDGARNNLDEANDELEKLVILAPFDGVIAQVNVKEGDLLSSVTYVTTIAIEVIDPSRMELDADVDEIDIPSVKLGQKVIIEVDALPDGQFEGVVTSISSLPVVEAGVVLYKVKTGFDVPQGSALKAGMSATVDIIINERSNVLLVPGRAIKQDSQGNPMVEVLVNEQIQERLVIVGISDFYQTEIVDGLEEGDIVVVAARPESRPSGPGFFFSD